MQQEPTRRMLELGEAHLPDHHLTVRPESALKGEADSLSNSTTDLSHELRTSLAIITLLCGNLDRLYERLGDEERRTMIQKMRRQTQRLNELVSDALTVRQEAAPRPSQAS